MARRAKRDPLEETLEQLAVWRRDPSEHQEEILALLSHRSPHVFSRALLALVDSSEGDPALSPEAIEARSEELLRRYQEFLEEPPAKSDPGCHGKRAIAEALRHTSLPLISEFLAMTRYVQEEGYGQNDSAGELRVTAAMALSERGYEDIHFVVLELLRDEAPSARNGVIAVCEHLRTEAAELLLRQRVREPDEDPAIVANMLEALVRINAARSLDFVRPYLLGRDDGLATCVALAIAESREIDGGEVLRRAYGQVYSEKRRERFLLPLAVSRSEASVDLLLTELAQAEGGFREKILEALGYCRGGGELERRIARALGG